MLPTQGSLKALTNSSENNKNLCKVSKNNSTGMKDLFIYTYKMANFIMQNKFSRKSGKNNV